MYAIYHMIHTYIRNFLNLIYQAMIHKPVAVATASTLLKFSTLPAFLVIASVSHISLPTASTLQVLNTSSIRFLSFFYFPHLLNYLQRQHFKFSTLPAFLVIASVSHISLPTASTLQVLNTSSISCHSSVSHISLPTASTLQVLNTSSISCHSSVSHISLPRVSTLQVLNTSSIPCHCFCFSHLLTYSVNTSQVLNTSQHFQHPLTSLLFLTSPYLRFSNRA